MSNEVKEEVEIEEGLRLEMEVEEPEEKPVEEPTSEEPPTKPEEKPEEPPKEEEPSEKEVTPEPEEKKEEAEVIADPELNAHGKAYYSDEEVLALLGEDGKYGGGIDTSRIKPGTPASAIYKAMESEFTPKLQERSELAKQMEQVTSQLEAMKQAQVQQQPTKGTGPQGQWTWQDEYNTNPINAMKKLDGKLWEARQADPYGEATLQLQQVKEDLSTMFMESQIAQQKQTSVMQSVYNQVQEAVPDYFERVEEYNAFAEKTLGFSSKDIAILTDINFWSKAGAPHIPVTIAKAIATMNNISKPKTASEVIQSKTVKTTPTAVEKPGSGHEQQGKPEPSTESDIEDISSGRFSN